MTRNSFLATKFRFNPQLMDALNDAADVVAQDLAQQLVELRHVRMHDTGGANGRECEMGYDGRKPERPVRSGRDMLLDWLADVPEVVWLAAEEPCSVCGWPTEQGELVKGERLPVCARCHLLDPLLRRLVQGRELWEPRGEG